MTNHKKQLNSEIRQSYIMTRDRLHNERHKNVTLNITFFNTSGLCIKILFYVTHRFSNRIT